MTGIQENLEWCGQRISKETSSCTGKGHERMKSTELMRLGNNQERLYVLICDNDNWVSRLVSPPDSGQAEETVCVSLHVIHSFCL